MEITRKARHMLDNLFHAFSITAGGKYVFLTDMKYDLSRWSRQAVEFFGLPSEYMENVSEIWLNHVHPDDREEYARSMEAIYKGETEEHKLQYRAMAKDGSYVVCTCQGILIRGENDEARYFAGAIQNHGAINYVDPTTGLRSLYGFLDDLKALLWKKTPALLMMVGISGFSDINNLYGYSFGNSVLRHVANLLTAEFSSVYRMDGTKFAVICENGEAEHLQKVYTELKHNATVGFIIDDERINPTLNGGIATVYGGEESLETVYSCLTYAYSESKKKKHGEAVVFNDASSDDNRKYIKMLNYIRSCVTENCKGFYLCYQPIVDANSERLKGAEALIRWKDDTYGVVPPVQFIPVLEQDALFPILGKWILRTALHEGKAFLEDYPDFILNVNLAYSQLEQNSFVDDVLDILHETGFPAQNLCLEITERCRILDINMLKNRFTALRDNGIRLALDDFGTGFSSIGLMREVPIDTIKVDREYVKNITTSQMDQSTIRSISRLADAFFAELCAEGIEDSEMRDYLRKYHVTSLQGYYYGKPVPIEQFLHDHKPAEGA
ncbi:MAG: EAL domain-containing protein [Oscillospiraceae bacterium]|nr:EAL domain-containing protein [Oscillospiraceae bacterium]